MQHRDKQMKTYERKLRNMEDRLRRSNLYLIGIPEEEITEHERIMYEHFAEMKDMSPQTEVT